MAAEEVTARVGPWTARHAPGGRLADVYHAESDEAVTCIEAPGWDHERFERARPCTASELRRALRRWASDEGDLYVREVVRYARS